jgi:glycerophosphoryl diester phosphodiesterase
MFGAKRFESINRLLNQAFADKTGKIGKKMLIAAHRGSWGGNVAENTKLAFSISLDMGADMFECDLSISADGVLYAYHNRQEERTFGIKEHIHTLHSGKINKLTYINSVGLDSGVHVELFEDVVAHFRNGELYNIDRAWTFLPEVAALLNKYPWAINQALIKSPVSVTTLDFLQNCPDKYMYMPIVHSMKDVETVLSYTDINTVGMELIAQTPEDDLFLDDNIQYIKSKRLFIWVNAITLGAGERWDLFGGLDDDLALTAGPDVSWGKMVSKGADIIQTDWPYQLREYLGCYREGYREESVTIGY